MSHYQEFDSLSLESIPHQSSTQPPRSQQKRSFRELRESHSQAEEEVFQPPLPSIQLGPLWKPSEVDQNVLLKKSKPMKDKDFQSILGLSSVAYNYKQLEKKLIEKHLYGKHTYEVECKLKEERGVDDDPFLQQPNESEEDYIFRRARYWETVDNEDENLCIRCDLDRSQRASEILPTFNIMDQFVAKNKSKLGKKQLYQKLWDLYYHLIRPNLPTPFIDPYTQKPRPKRIWSLEQIENHYEHHIEDIPTSQEDELKKFKLVFNKMYGMLLEKEEITGEERWNLPYVKLWLEIHKQMMTVQKSVKTNRGG